MREEHWVAVGRDACMHDDERRACTNLAYRTNVPTSLEAHNQGTVWHEVKKKQYIWKYLSSYKKLWDKDKLCQAQMYN